MVDQLQSVQMYDAAELRADQNVDAFLKNLSIVELGDLQHVWQFIEDYVLADIDCF